MSKARKSSLSSELVAYVAESLGRLRNPAKALEMAAYMKTEMPFYGVQKPDRIPILRELKHSFRPSNEDEYNQCVLALWQQPHREEKYCAITYAASFPDFVVSDALPLYERLIREGAWWDFVDNVSVELVGDVYLKERKIVKPIMNKWSKDRDKWIRRASLLSHLHHKHETDQEQLFALCLRLAAEKEFFIRKAIGWSLREYSKTNPKGVKRFLADNKSLLSPLSYREGAKHLIKTGLIRV